jgi:hypothetical protein
MGHGEQVMRFHLLRDVGMYKATVKRSFESNDRGPEFDGVAELLRRKTQSYTLAELRDLAGFFWTAHDECVDENPEEYSPVEVYTSRRKMATGWEAVARIDALEKQQQSA